MAQYTEYIKASRITVCDYLANTESEAGRNFTIQHAGTYSPGSHFTNSYTYAKFLFPLKESQHRKTKRLVYAESNKGINFYPVSKNIYCRFSFDDYAEFPDGAEAAADFEIYDIYQTPQNRISVSLKNTVGRLALNSSNYLNYSGYVSTGNDVLIYLSIPYLGTNGSRTYNYPYVYDVSVGVAGIGSGNEPSIVLVWEDVVPDVHLDYPATNFYINPQRPYTFRWSLAQSLVSEDRTVLTHTDVLKWRVRGSATIHDIPAGDGSVVVRAGTFPRGDIEWAVEVTTSDGVTNELEWRPFTTIDAVPLAPTISYPVGAFVDRSNSAVFRWQYNNIAGSEQTTAELQRSMDGSAWQSLAAVTGAVTQASIPADTFGAGVWFWRVRTANADGVYGPWSSAESFTTDDDPPNAPTIISPVDVFVAGDADMEFRWRHNSPNGTAQTAATLQASLDGVSWLDFYEYFGQDQTIIVPAHSIAAGSQLWRVRTYNLDGEPGAWSSPAQIVVIASPEPPAIASISSTPRVTVSWQAADQKAWRVRFEDAAGHVFDSGDRFGQDKAFTAAYLADGEASVEVTVANEYGKTSTVERFRVANTAAGSITISGSVYQDCAELSISSTGSFDRMYLLRNGQPIAKLDGAEYTDKAAAGEVTYQVLGAVGDDYTLSNEISLSVYPKTCSIYDVTTDGELIALYIRRNDVMTIDRNEAQAVNYISYAGRKYPVPYDTGNHTAAFSIAVTRDVRSSDLFESMLGHVVCVKDKTGWSRTCVLDSINYGIDRYTDISLDFTVVDDEAGVEYE